MEFIDQLKILRQTKHVHGKWYSATYPEVAAMGMDPAEHYLRYGAPMGRNPGKNFDTTFYLSLYPQAVESKLNPLVYYWLYGKDKGHVIRPSKGKSSSVKRISTNLFSLGFTAEPLRDLENLALEGEDKKESAEAARELALWHMRPKTREGYYEALRYIEIARKRNPSLEMTRKLAVIELVCMYQLGDKEAALEAYETSLLSGLASPDLRLAAANLQQTPEEKLRQINLALSSYGVPGASLLNGNDSTLYDRLTACVDSPCIIGGPKISVLLAAYEAQDTLATALRSLQEQTWKNIEVLVLDDCSPSTGTRDVTERFSQQDSRIKYVPMEVNGGAYIARNRGLDLATGDFITIHDADDWSHPLKLETQAKFLIENAEVLGCTSEQARCTEALEFTKVRGGGQFIVFNTSSFMWKADPVREALGYWDTVRFGADNEFIRRMVRVFGKSSFVKLNTGPLSFQREAHTSITGDPVKGIDIGGYYGVRKEYLLAQEHYHGQEAAVLRYRNDSENRPFPAPEMMNEVGGASIRNGIDLAIYGDFRLGSPDVPRALQTLNSMEPSSKIALIERALYDSQNGTLAWDPAIRSRIDGKHVIVLVYGDFAECKQQLFLSYLESAGGQRLMPSVTCCGQDTRTLKHPPAFKLLAKAVAKN